jgi:hypothetical protein
MFQFRYQSVLCTVFAEKLYDEFKVKYGSDFRLPNFVWAIARNIQEGDDESSLVISIRRMSDALLSTNEIRPIIEKVYAGFAEVIGWAAHIHPTCAEGPLLVRPMTDWTVAKINTELNNEDIKQNLHEHCLLREPIRQAEIVQVILDRARQHIHPEFEAPGFAYAASTMRCFDCQNLMSALQNHSGHVLSLNHSSLIVVSTVHDFVTNPSNRHPVPSSLIDNLSKGEYELLVESIYADVSSPFGDYRGFENPRFLWKAKEERHNEKSLHNQLGGSALMAFSTFHSIVEKHLKSQNRRNAHFAPDPADLEYEDLENYLVSLAEHSGRPINTLNSLKLLHVAKVSPETFGEGVQRRLLGANRRDVVQWMTDALDAVQFQESMKEMSALDGSDDEPEYLDITDEEPPPPKPIKKYFNGEITPEVEDKKMWMEHFQVAEYQFDEIKTLNHAERTKFATKVEGNAPRLYELLHLARPVSDKTHFFPVFYGIIENKLGSELLHESKVRDEIRQRFIKGETGLSITQVVLRLTEWKHRKYGDFNRVCGIMAYAIKNATYGESNDDA